MTKNVKKKYKTTTNHTSKVAPSRLTLYGFFAGPVLFLFSCFMLFYKAESTEALLLAMFGVMMGISLTVLSFINFRRGLLRFVDKYL